ncbi:MAG: hypothetical protein HY069_02565 [Chlamydiia bacterium]|nr:hypothetical protein [Chlamydiia bacterium]
MEEMQSSLFNMSQMCFIFSKKPLNYALLFFFLTMLHGNERFLNYPLSGDAICKTYEIQIPDYESAHNPSIVSYRDGYLLSFRCLARFPEWSQDKLIDTVSFIGLAFLDKQFKVKKKSVQLLEIPTYSDDCSLYAEDARLVVFQDRIFVVFNDLPAPLPDYQRQLYIAEIIYQNGRWVPKKRAMPLFLENMHRIEKNWVPFFINQSLYFIYGENPHTILACDLSTGRCRKVDEREVPLDWPYGIIRGGTPALKVGDEFLTFYHSSLLPSALHENRIYFMGAYTFEDSFPFAIRSFTPVPIGLAEYYKEISSKKHLSKKAVFPGSFVQEGNTIHLAWGKDDKRVMITSLDLDKLRQSMQKIR